MKYALFDSEGTLLTRLIGGVNEIPADAVAVDEALWRRITQETDGLWRLGADGIYKAELPPPSLQSLMDAAQAQRDALLLDATMRMAPLQDAVALGRVTPEEQTALTAWMEYRVNLSRLERQAGYPRDIDWPVAPVTTRLTGPGTR